MKITLNEHNALIDSDTGKSLGAVTGFKIPKVSWDNNPFAGARDFADGLTMVEAHDVLINKIGFIENIMLPTIESHDDFVDKAFEDLAVVRQSLEDVDTKEVASMLFRGGADNPKPYELEVSDMAAQYVATDSSAYRVATTNILTGVHIGNTVDGEYLEILREVFAEISNALNGIFDDVEDVIAEENPEDYADDFDDEDDWDDDDYDDEDYDDYVADEQDFLYYCNDCEEDYSDCFCDDEDALTDKHGYVENNN